jgi:hypothetical protein
VRRWPGWPKRSATPGRLRLRAAAGWVGLLFLVGGAALAVTTFVHSALVASLGLAVMGCGLWRLVVDRSGGVTGRCTLPGVDRNRSCG